jgi:hypothetical protein
MPRFSFVILLAILLLSQKTRGQQQDGSVFEKRVTINQKNQTLNAILDQLSWQAGVYFSYNASLQNSNAKFSIEANDKSLFTVLNQLFDPSEFKFTELENQVIISGKIDKELPVKVNTDSIPVKYFFLSAKIIDDKKGNPIPYATVSLLNKPIGTISNSDGDFLLKIHPDYIRDSLIISSMGFSQILIPAYKLLDEDLIIMNTFSIRIKEVKVTAITPDHLLENIRKNLTKNYCENARLMTGFYRETVQQDGNYINISEAVIEVLKAPYSNDLRVDLVRLIKGRRSPDVKPFQWLNFKLQGGPFTITKLDVVKTMESFLDEKYESLYSYNITKVIWYNKNPVYVLSFKPASDAFDEGFAGEIYVHRESFAIVHIEFHLNKTGLKNAENILVKKKPKGVKAKPTYVYYNVSYQQFDGKWHLANAKASIKFKVRSKRDKLNSEYQSVSDLLITDINATELRKFSRDESIKQRDIFVEMINEYDQKFWENYNIIQPDEDLQNAFKNHSEN